MSVSDCLCVHVHVGAYILIYCVCVSLYTCVICMQCLQVMCFLCVFVGEGACEFECMYICSLHINFTEVYYNVNVVLCLIYCLPRIHKPELSFVE